MYLRRILISILGVVIALAAFLLGIFFEGVADMIGSKMTIGTTGFSYAKRLSGGLYFYLYVALCIATGCAFVSLFWDNAKRLSFKFATRVLIYIALLVLILPISVYNYMHSDFLINRQAQAALNLILIFVGLVIVELLSRYSINSTDGRVLRLIGVIVLSVMAIYIPAVFSTIWFFNSVGLKDLASGIEKIGVPGASAIALAATAAHSVLNRRKLFPTEKPKASKES